MRKQYHTFVDGLIALMTAVDVKLQLLESREEQWSAMLARSERGTAENRVVLYVGGRRFEADRRELSGSEGSYFQALLGTPRCTKAAEDVAYFIDRDPEQFERVLRTLRTGEPPCFDGLDVGQAERLRADLDYYQLPHSAVQSPCKRAAPKRVAAAQAVPLQWDSARCSMHLTLSEGGRTVKKNGGAGWRAVLATTGEVSRVKVRIRQRGPSGDIMVGFAKAGTFAPEGHNFTRSGWFLYVRNGSLYSGFGDSGRKYREALSDGDVLEVLFDKSAGTLAFIVNGTNNGVAFSAVSDPSDFILPCVAISQVGACLVMET